MSFRESSFGRLWARYWRSILPEDVHWYFEFPFGPEELRRRIRQYADLSSAPEDFWTRPTIRGGQLLMAHLDSDLVMLRGRDVRRETMGLRYSGPAPGGFFAGQIGPSARGCTLNGVWREAPAPGSASHAFAYLFGGLGLLFLALPLITIPIALRSDSSVRVFVALATCALAAFTLAVLLIPDRRNNLAIPTTEEIRGLGLKHPDYGIALKFLAERATVAMVDGHDISPATRGSPVSGREKSLPVWVEIIACTYAIGAVIGAFAAFRTIDYGLTGFVGPLSTTELEGALWLIYGGLVLAVATARGVSSYSLLTRKAWAISMATRTTVATLAALIPVFLMNMGMGASLFALLVEYLGVLAVEIAMIYYLNSPEIRKLFSDSETAANIR